MMRFALCLPLLALAPPQEPTETASPRLVVMVVVDQMIPEQLERLGPLLQGGLGRFVHKGQLWREGAHEHGITQTGPGHATLGTGVNPARHGIVANSWRGAEAEIYCCEDLDVQTVTSAGTHGERLRSPVLLMAPGLSDFLRAASPDAKTIGIAAKDRAAVLTTGGAADHAIWWDRTGAGFVSSSYYSDTLPTWVDEWNANWAPRFFDSDPDGWTEIAKTDLTHLGTQPDERPGEAGLLGSKTFPHPAPEFDFEDPRRLADWIYGTPFVDRFVIDLALRAIEEMELGVDDAVDALFVGLSACDVVGHRFGPYSHEVTDVVLRADIELERLFKALDEKLGPDGWVAALSSDHGVLPLVEHLADTGHDAHRFDGSGMEAPIVAAQAALTAEFGSDYVIEVSVRGVRLDRAGLAAAGLDAAHFRRVFADSLVSVPWIARAYTREDLLAPDIEADPLIACMARSFVPERSPDVVIVSRPWHLIFASNAGTSHGTPYPYDRRVPIAFFGPGSTVEERFDACATVDVLPTLLSRAGVDVPDGLDGRVLK